jgi:hypothetical protein
LAITPVDISYGLDLILKEDWQSDRAFQEAVALLLDKVQDAHLVCIRCILKIIMFLHYLFLVLFSLLLPSVHILAAYPAQRIA